MPGTVAARGSSRHRRATRGGGGAAADVGLARARRPTAGWCAVAGGPHSGCVRWGLARAPPPASSQAAGGPPPRRGDGEEGWTHAPEVRRAGRRGRGWMCRLLWTFMMTTHFMCRSCWVSRMAGACGRIHRRRTTWQPHHRRHDAPWTPGAGPAQCCHLPPPGPTAAPGSRGRRALPGRPRRRRSRGRVPTYPRAGASAPRTGARTRSRRPRALRRPPSSGAVRWAGSPPAGWCAGLDPPQRAVR